MKKYIQPKLKCISLTVLLHYCSCRQGDDQVWVDVVPYHK